MLEIEPMEKSVMVRARKHKRAVMTELRSTTERYGFPASNDLRMIATVELDEDFAAMGVTLFFFFLIRIITECHLNMTVEELTLTPLHFPFLSFFMVSRFHVLFHKQMSLWIMDTYKDIHLEIHKDWDMNKRYHRTGCMNDPQDMDHLRCTRHR